MAKIDSRATIQATVTLALSESEAAALDALVGYGVEPFLKVFYKELGEAYLKPHEAGLRSLFESVSAGDASVYAHLRRSADAREVFYGRKKAVSE